MTNEMQRRSFLPPSRYIARHVLGLDAVITLSGSTMMVPVCDRNSADVGIMIPLVGQRRKLVVRTDPNNDGYYRVRLLNAQDGVLDTLSRVPEEMVFETAFDAVVLGEMGSF